MGICPYAFIFGLNKQFSQNTDPCCCTLSCSLYSANICCPCKCRDNQRFYEFRLDRRFRFPAQKINKNNIRFLADIGIENTIVSFRFVYHWPVFRLEPSRCTGIFAIENNPNETCLAYEHVRVPFAILSPTLTAYHNQSSMIPKV